MRATSRTGIFALCALASAEINEFARRLPGLVDRPKSAQIRSHKAPGVNKFERVAASNWSDTDEICFFALRLLNMETRRSRVKWTRNSAWKQRLKKSESGRGGWRKDNFIYWNDMKTWQIAFYLWSCVSSLGVLFVLLFPGMLFCARWNVQSRAPLSIPRFIAFLAGCFKILLPSTQPWNMGVCAILRASFR